MLRITGAESPLSGVYALPKRFLIFKLFIRITGVKIRFLNPICETSPEPFQKPFLYKKLVYYARKCTYIVRATMYDSRLRGSKL